MTIDNQQERLLWWLGGIIDGEGCITINHNRLHKGSLKETLLFTPLIVITNTNRLIIEMCEKVFRDNGLAFYTSYNAPNPNKNYQEKWSIRIQGIKRCVRTLNVISPYLIGKKEEANLVKRFCENRLKKNEVSNGSQGRKRDGRKWGGNAKYDDSDFEIIYKVAEIHNRNPQRLYAEIRSYQKRIAKQAIV